MQHGTSAQLHTKAKKAHDQVLGTKFYVVNGKLPVDAIVLLCIHLQVVVHEPASLDEIELLLCGLDLLFVDADTALGEHPTSLLV